MTQTPPVPVHRLDTVGSTNTEAMDRLRAGQAAPFWVLAAQQSAARGRRGRAWFGGRGNFYGSRAGHVPGGPAEAALMSFGAALALDKALQRAGLAADRIALKWPNDVLVDGRKIAGILLESTLLPDGLGLVTGLGVNFVTAPDAADLEAGALAPIALADCGVIISPDAFLDLLEPDIAAWAEVLAERGFSPLRTAWLARAARLGEDITARTGTRVLNGIFETVDETGALVLRTREGTEALPAADVYFGETEGHHASGH